MVVALEDTAPAKQHPYRLVVECLTCGWERVTFRSATGHVEPAACPGCRGVGWREADLASTERPATRPSL